MGNVKEWNSRSIGKSRDESEYRHNDFGERWNTVI